MAGTKTQRVKEFSLKKRELTREVLLEEFTLEASNQLTDAQVDELSWTVKAAMVLSAPPEKRGDKFIEATPENVKRVHHTIETLLRLCFSSLRRSKGSEPKINAKLIQEEGYLLILNGETEQLPMMVEVALQAGWPATNIILIDCGKRGVGNTRTQFTVLKEFPYAFNRIHDLRQLVDHNRILVVTTWHHVPRVRRTAAATRKDAHYMLPVIGVPLERCNFPTKGKVEEEIDRILTYAKKGDIRPFPPKQQLTLKH